MPKTSTLAQLQRIHKSILAGQVVLAIVAVWLVYSGHITTQAELDRPLQLICVTVAAIGFFAGKRISEKKMEAGRSAPLLAEKATYFKQACLLQWVLLTAPASLSLVGFLLTGNIAFILLAAALIFWCAQSAPHRLKVMLLLGVREDELADF